MIGHGVLQVVQGAGQSAGLSPISTGAPSSVAAKEPESQKTKDGGCMAPAPRTNFGRSLPAATQGPALAPPLPAQSSKVGTLRTEVRTEIPHFVLFSPLQLVPPVTTIHHPRPATLPITISLSTHT